MKGLQIANIPFPCTPPLPAGEGTGVGYMETDDMSWL